MYEIQRLQLFDHFATLGKLARKCVVRSINTSPALVIDDVTGFLCLQQPELDRVRLTKETVLKEQ